MKLKDILDVQNILNKYICFMRIVIRRIINYFYY